MLLLNPLSPRGKTSVKEAYLPAAQAMQVLWPALEYVPAAQATQVLSEVAPGATEDVPAAQATQVLAEAAPAAAEDVPAAQAMQADALGEVSLRRW
jgi:hypothetical protein